MIGEGGRLSNKGGTLSQYVLQQLVAHNPDDRDKDPRAAILRHAKEAEENPYWIDPAYKKFVSIFNLCNHTFRITSQDSNPYISTLDLTMIFIINNVFYSHSSLIHLMFPMYEIIIIYTNSLHHMLNHICHLKKIPKCEK